MHTYAVALVSLFDNELTIRFVEADSPEEAAIQVLDPNGEWVELVGKDLEGIKNQAWDCDQLIAVEVLP